jgi:hypothetical protein
MHAPRTACLVAALVLTASVPIIVSACEAPTLGLSKPDPPDFLVTVSVTPDTAHPHDSVLAQTMVRNIGGSGYQPTGLAYLHTLTLADRDDVYFPFHVPSLAPNEETTVEVSLPLNGWPAPDSVRVTVRITRSELCGMFEVQFCSYRWSAADTLVVVP